jgi:acyl carrier protein
VYRENQKREHTALGLTDQVLEKLIQRAAEIFKKQPADLNTDAEFTADLKAKSVNLVQIITVVADAFDVEIPLWSFAGRRPSERRRPALPDYRVNRKNAPIANSKHTWQGVRNSAVAGQ